MDFQYKNPTIYNESLSLKVLVGKTSQVKNTTIFEITQALRFTMGDSFSWTRFQLLNFLGKENVIKIAEKLGIPLSILASLCNNGDNNALVQEVLGFTESFDALVQEGLAGFTHAMRLENHFISHGLEREWNKVQERYAFDPMRSYFALQKVLRVQQEQIQMENQIEENLPQIEQKLNAFLLTLLEIQGSGNTLQLINPKVLSHVQDLYNILIDTLGKVIEIIVYYKYSKRYEHHHRQQPALDWPVCPKFQQWLAALLRQSWNFANYARQLKTHFDTLVNLPGNVMEMQDLATVHNLAINAVDMVSRLLNATSVVKLDAKTGFVKYPSNIRVQFRQLLGRQLSQMIPQGSRVKLSLINADHVKSLLENSSRHSSSGDVGSVPSAELQNNDGEIQPHEEEGVGHFIVNFSKCRVVKPNRIVSSRRSSSGHAESVMDEKSCFLCEFIVQLFPDLRITVWTLSDPVVVGSNILVQEIRSLATLFWDNALRNVIRSDLEVPRSANCSQIIEAMEEEQKAITQVGFSEQTKNYLMTRLQGDDPSGAITFERFCEGIIPETDFTIWQWFLEGLRLGESHFLSMWTGGYVEGFLGRNWTERVLSTRSPGTFLVRISESVLAAVTVSWIHSDCKVYSLGPFTKSVLTWKELPDAITDLSGRLNLKQVYPDQDLGIFLALHTPVPSPERPIPIGYVRVLQQLKLLSLPVSA